ncbi:unnamed protein product [Chondrus crispus]|uniref:Uncharacterized protein n=1 Tax=Chondrus crispus TaxID=2769 RepID=R7QMM2_CHOCR|nr:unnamed protein product [Chondrus crispus]CDF38983.1 unnamed protein product [Chondrus crispus]|eukprot:XP_005718888.1 unnamed protein product [Chondrus crispus]
MAASHRFLVAALLLALSCFAAAQQSARDTLSLASATVSRETECTTGYCGHAAPCCPGYFCGPEVECVLKCNRRPCGDCCYGWYCSGSRCTNKCRRDYCGHGEFECCPGFYCEYTGKCLKKCSKGRCGRGSGKKCCEGWRCKGKRCRRV